MMQTYDDSRNRMTPQRKGIISGAIMKSAEGGNDQNTGAKPPAQEEGSPLDRVLVAAMKVLYDKSTSDGVVNMLRKGEPVQALAQTSLFVMKALYDESKGTIPPPVMVPASGAVTDYLAELSQAAGVQLSEEQAAQAKQFVMERLSARFSKQAAPTDAAPTSQEQMTAVPQEGV